MVLKGVKKVTGNCSVMLQAPLKERKLSELQIVFLQLLLTLKGISDFAMKLKKKKKDKIASQSCKG